MIESTPAGASRTSTASSVSNTTHLKPRIHLVYLDGLRGLAALYVVIFHVYMKLFINSGKFPPGFALANYGGLAVDVFIVLSGYCLMLPIVRTPEGKLSGGATTFLKRRAWRILPPYYAALTMTTGLLLTSNYLSRSHGMAISSKEGDLTFGSIISHLLLIHNINSTWRFTIDGSMWSVATEWQIYFLLPAFLLPLWQRWGLAALLGGAWVLGLLPLLFASGFANSAHSWLLGLFAMGMTAASINFPRRPGTWAERYPSGSVALCCVVALLCVLQIYGPETQRRWMLDVLMGTTTSALMIYCTSLRTGRNSDRKLGKPFFILRILESRALVSLGAFSYSLYLVHGPFLAILIFLLHRHLAGNTLLLFMLGIGIPIALGLSYLFYLCFEKPFLRIRTNMTRAASEVSL